MNEPAPALECSGGSVVDQATRYAGPEALEQLKDRLPTLPAIALQVTTLASDPECSSADLGGLIARDPTLSLQVLRAVNSAYYGRRGPISTVPRAVAFMGVHAVRNLVLCLVAKGVFAPPPCFPLEAFWEGALRRAASARLLARQLGLPREDELFTLGLVQEIGLLALALLEPQHAPTLAEAFDRLAEQRLEVERPLIGHDELGYRLLCGWQLEPSFVAPLRYHHRLELCDPEDRPRARVLRAADALADLATAADKLVALREAEGQLAGLGIATEGLAGLLHEIDALVQASAQMLGIGVGSQPELAEILARAADGLAEVNLGYQQIVGELEVALDRQRMMAIELQRLNQQLQRDSTTDTLTGLPNRRALDAALERELSQARRQKSPLSLLMIDIDRFKPVNDRYGHAAGDAVLRGVARALSAVMRRSDLVARYGGEEFVALLPFTSLDGARCAADRVRRQVEATAVEWQGQSLAVTVSVGCAQVGDVSAPRAGVVALRDADDALYVAKERGRNCVQVAEIRAIAAP